MNVEELAERYFDEFIAPRDRNAGVPEWVLIRMKQKYIIDVKLNPKAIEQLKEIYA